MTDGRFIGLGGVGLLAVICCAAPFLLVAAGSFGVSAWLAVTGYVLSRSLSLPLGWRHFTLTGAAIPARRRMPLAADHRQKTRKN